MAIVITNGQHYMKYNEKGVLKGANFNDAVKFESLKAAKKAYRGLKSCNKNFIIYDTALHKVLYSEQDQGKDQLRVLNNKFDGNTPAICKRKGFGVKQRKQIYEKTEGHCYLCGVQFTMPSGLHSVLERPFSEANGRPFLVKRSPLIVC